MSSDRVPLYVRLPREQAAALDRLADSTGQRKQQLVSELLSDRLVVGRAEIVEQQPSAVWQRPVAEDVLTVGEVAALLRVSGETVRASAAGGELPGRRLGDEWRFSRAAVMAWLAQSGGTTGEQTNRG